MHLIDCYAHSNRWRTRHPAEKAMFALGLLAWSVILPFPGAVIILGVVVVAALAGARVPWRVYLRVMAIPAVFILVGSASLLVGVASEAGGWRLTLEHDLSRAFHLMLRAFAAASCLNFLALTTPSSEWLPLLRQLRVPGVVVDLMTLMYRMLFIFSERLAAMETAQTGRLGYATARNALRSSGLIGANLFVRALVRARRMEVGMASRCYNNDVLTLLPDRKASRAVLLLIAGLWLLLVVAVFAFRRWWYA
jgi:cobalt/nickel transport system permease protein